jgi:DNA invertase Pin-like site-specific DNA recombinase
MQKIAIYARVSTKRQDTRSQEPDLHQWANAFANGTPVEWYRDKATGKTMDRPGWKRLEADMRAGRVSALVCWRLDRLGRTASGLTALFDELIARKVNLVSIKDGIDLSTPAGRLIANVLASVAAYETEVRSERIVAGQAVARANGKHWGGSVKGRRIKVKPDQERIISQMRGAGEKIAVIARATGLSRPTVYSVLANGHAVSLAK